jgi:flavin reductase (DIM6/NTAB) family NADH-FMN oxidoreductase RutF
MSGPDRIPPAARALGAVPSGLFVATAGRGAAATGSLVSFVQQVGFTPPCLTVAIRKGRPLEALIRGGRRFCLSILDDASINLLSHFARGFDPGQPAFDGVSTEVDEAGVPYLLDAVAWLSCSLIGEADWSDHVVFCGEVVAGDRRRPDQPLVHVRKTGLSY